MPCFVSALVNVSPQANLLKIVCSISLHQIVTSALDVGVSHVDAKSCKCYVASNTKHYLGVPVQAKTTLSIVVD